MSDRLQFLATLLLTQNCCWVEYKFGCYSLSEHGRGQKSPALPAIEPNIPASGQSLCFDSEPYRAWRKKMLYVLHYSAVWTEKLATSSFRYSNFWDLFRSPHRDLTLLHSPAEEEDDDDDMVMTILIMITVMVAVVMIMNIMIPYCVFRVISWRQSF